MQSSERSVSARRLRLTRRNPQNHGKFGVAVASASCSAGLSYLSDKAFGKFYGDLQIKDEWKKTIKPQKTSKSRVVNTIRRSSRKFIRYMNRHSSRKQCYTIAWRGLRGVGVRVLYSGYAGRR